MASCRNALRRMAPSAYPARLLPRPGAGQDRAHQARRCKIPGSLTCQTVWSTPVARWVGDRPTPFAVISASTRPNSTPCPALAERFAIPQDSARVIPPHCCPRHPHRYWPWSRRRVPPQPTPHPLYLARAGDGLPGPSVPSPVDYAGHPPFWERIADATHARLALLANMVRPRPAPQASCPGRRVVLAPTTAELRDPLAMPEAAEGRLPRCHRPSTLAVTKTVCSVCWNWRPCAHCRTSGLEF